MGNKKCVVVDDMEGIRKFVCACLATIDVDAVSFANAQEALEYIRGNDVDLLVSDIDMPGMSGLELLEKVKTDFPGIVCIMMSGGDQKEQEEKSLQLNADVFIAKPFKLEEFIELMKRAI